MLGVKDWSSFQSYKDRKPPWIRLHKTLLDNFEFHSMSVNARAILPMLWLLASEDEDPVSGALRDSYEKISFRLRLPKKDIESAIRECLATGFLEEINEETQQVTEPLRIRTQTVTPETETETETERAPTKIDFDFSTGKFSNVTPEKLSLWKSAYPAISLQTEMAKAASWLMENPKNRKSNYGKFLTGWFSRSQDSAPKAPPQKTGYKMISPAGG